MTHKEPTPATTDPSLQQGNVPAPEEAGRLLIEFWQSDPTEIWQPVIERADEALAVGVPVVMVSGLHGIGKSMQFFGTLKNERPEGSVRQIMEIPKTEERVMTPGTFEHGSLGRASLILSDESHVDTPDKATAVVRSIRNGIQAGKQWIIVIPGPNQEVRKKGVQLLTSALGEQGLAVENLGDITDVHIPPERSSEFMRSVGFTEEVIALFDELEPLRAPRIFANFMDNFIERPNEITTADVRAILHELVRVRTADDPAIVSIGNNFAYNLVSEDQGRLSVRPPHGLMRTNSLTTADCVKLYEALGEQLPGVEEFESQELYEYAYHKD